MPETELLPARYEDRGSNIVTGALSVKDLRTQVKLIQEVMRDVMQEDTHFGKIPGCGDKPALLKPGAEKLCFVFRLAPEFTLDERQEGEHYTVVCRCRLTSINSGAFIGDGWAMCSSRETRYAFRTMERKCPACGKEAIIKGKAEYGGGFLCWAKKGGCSAKFLEDDPAIVEQVTGKTPNESLPDTYNTVLKMAQKRAMVAAVLVGTAASDLFTQDIEDFQDAGPPKPEKPAGKMAAKQESPLLPEIRKQNERIKRCGFQWGDFVKGDPHKMSDEQLQGILDSIDWECRLKEGEPAAKPEEKNDPRTPEHQCFEECQKLHASLPPAKAQGYQINWDDLAVADLQTMRGVLAELKKLAGGV